MRRAARRNFMPPPHAAHMHSEKSWSSGDHTILLYQDWPPDHKQVKKWALFESDMWDPNWKLGAILGDVRPDDVFTATRNGDTKTFLVVKTYPTRRIVTTCALQII